MTTTQQIKEIEFMGLKLAISDVAKYNPIIMAVHRELVTGDYVDKSMSETLSLLYSKLPDEYKIDIDITDDMLIIGDKADFIGGDITIVQGVDNLENKLKGEAMGTLRDYEKVINLSHVDADGYGCTFLLRNVCEANDIKFDPFHTDYGKEMEVMFEEAFNFANSVKDDFKTLFIITDLNPTKEMLNKLKYDAKFDVLIIDHHQVKEGIELTSYPFYNVDNEYSATMLVYKWLSETFDVSDYKPFVEYINNGDIFKNTLIPEFKISRYMANIVHKESKQIPRYLINPNADYMFIVMKMLNGIVKSLEDINITDDNINRILYNIDAGITPSYIHKMEEHMFGSTLKAHTRDSVIIDYLVGVIPLYIETYETNGYKYMVVLDVPNFSDVANELFKVSELDFIVNLTKNGGCGIRVAPDSDIMGNKLAEYIHPRGGGHQKSAGCQYEVSEEVFYKLNPDIELLSIIDSYLNGLS